MPSAGGAQANVSAGDQPMESVEGGVGSNGEPNHIVFVEKSLVDGFLDLLGFGSYD